MGERGLSEHCGMCSSTPCLNPLDASGIRTPELCQPKMSNTLPDVPGGGEGETSLIRNHCVGRIMAFLTLGMTDHLERRGPGAPIYNEDAAGSTPNKRHEHSQAPDLSGPQHLTCEEDMDMLPCSVPSPGAESSPKEQCGHGVGKLAGRRHGKKEQGDRRFQTISPGTGPTGDPPVS